MVYYYNDRGGLVYWGISYKYHNYGDLKYLKKMAPARYATKTRNGIPCEYYSVPRTITDSPSGYTTYNDIIKYDINDTHQLVKVCIRRPQYQKDGILHTEILEIFPDKYSQDTVVQLSRQKFKLFIMN